MTEPTGLEGDELDDGTERTSFSLAIIDTKLLTSPTVVRSVVGVGFGLALLAWPDRTDRILTRLVGLTFLLVSLSALWTWIHMTQREKASAVASSALLVTGALLLAAPDRSTVFLGRVIGLALIGFGILGVHRIVWGAQRNRGQLAIHVLASAVGVVLILQTEAVIGTVIAAGALVSIAVSLLMLVMSLDARTTGTATYAETTAIVGRWLSERPKSVAARQTLYEKILYEGSTTTTRVARFFSLMGFAAVIASMGVITDSTAVVIGAMLVAPLMTPLMGMAISLVMGWPNRLTRSATIALGGIIFAIGIGWLLGLIVPTPIDTAANVQILSRSSPTILDLFVAVAAGAAGAYGLSRPDVSDALPGVAIAISLVPPLAVVGISYSQADWTAGHGALLLFATNMVAILIVGGVTFIVTGVTPIARVTENQHRVRTALGVTLTAAVLVFGALLLNGAQITANTLRQSTAEETVDDWLDATENHRLVNVIIDGDTVTAVVVGPSEGLPPVDKLADRLGQALDAPVRVNVSLVVEERFSAQSE